MKKILTGFVIAILLLNVVLNAYVCNLSAFFGWALSLFYLVMYNVKVKNDDDL